MSTENSADGGGGDAPVTPEESAENKQEMRDPDLAEPPPDPAKFIGRADWGAKPPKWIDALQTPVNKVVLTWTETAPCLTEDECRKAVRELQAAHMKEEGVPDIKHNFLVGGDGAIYEGRGYTRVGPTYPPKTQEDLTGKSIEIAFIQQHDVRLNDKVVKAGTDITAYQKGYVEDKFKVYWVINEEIAKQEEVEMK